MVSLRQKKCVPCEGGVDPLRPNDIQRFIVLVDGWDVIDDFQIYKEFKFDNFQQSLDFVNDIGEIAEDEGHHPDLEIGWGYVRVTLWTHAINGLSENDFILAAKIDVI